MSLAGDPRKRFIPWWLAAPSQRRADLQQVRQGLREARQERRWDPATLERLIAARKAITGSQGRLRACETCARGCDPPHGHWEGGFCCGGQTAELFSPQELAALAAIGVKPRELSPPASREQAGCTFRGPKGCSLTAEVRPNVCLWYLCRDVSQELGHAGRGKEVGAHAKELEQAFIAFAGKLKRES